MFRTLTFTTPSTFNVIKSRCLFNIRGGNRHVNKIIAYKTNRIKTFKAFSMSANRRNCTRP